MPIISGSTPATNPEVITSAIPLVPCKEQIKPAPEQLDPVPFLEAHMQPSIDNKLGGSYIMEAQATQLENVSCNTSTSNSGVIMQEYLRNHFNEQLDDKSL